MAQPPGLDLDSLADSGVIASPSALTEGAAQSTSPATDLDALADSGVVSQVHVAQNETPSHTQVAHHATRPQAPVATPIPINQKYVTSGTPAPAATPEPTWGQTAQSAAKNFLPSLMDTGKSMVNAVTHLPQTLSNINQLSQGIGTQLQQAVGLPVNQTPQQLAKTQAVAKALENHYATSYGSVKGFKNAVSTDPTGILLDASTLLDGAGAAARVAGTAGKIGALTDAGNVVAKTAEMANPISAAVKLAKVPFKVASKVVPIAQSLETGKTIRGLATAAQAGSEANPVLRNSFTGALNGSVSPESTVDKVTSAIGQLSNQRAQTYIQNMKNITGGNLPQMDYAPVNAALQKNIGSNLDNGVVVDDDANKVLEAIQNKVNEYQQAVPSPTIENFDNIKKSIDGIRDAYPFNSKAYAKASDVRTAVVNAIKDQNGSIGAQYADAMSQYGNASDNISQLRNTFGVKGNPNTETVFNKLMSAKDGSTKESLISQLGTIDPTIPYELAGHELTHWMPGGIRGALAAAGPIFGAPGIAAGAAHLAAAGPIFGAPGIAAGAAHLAAAGIAAGAAHLAASSPRLMGLMNYGVGRAGGLANAASGAVAPVSEAANALGNVNTMTGVVNPPTPSPPPIANAAPTGAPVEGSMDFSPIFQAMLQKESGNNQFDKNGNVIESPKGAIGAAQIEPSTGPEAAQLAGLPWDPDKFRNDIDYNRTLGAAYHQHLTQQFGGDPILGAAAYNAGAKRVQSALKQAAATGDSWMKYIPAETQKYVANLPRPGHASGGKVAHPHEHLVQRLMKKAKDAKRITDKSTEPLLNVPDDAIAKALNIAKRAI